MFITPIVVVLSGVPIPVLISVARFVPEAVPIPVIVVIRPVVVVIARVGGKVFPIPVGGSAPMLFSESCVLVVACATLVLFFDYGGGDSQGFAGCVVVE